MMQSCSIRCLGCQNHHLWTAEGGEYWDTRDLARHLVRTELSITITGGEPFDQVVELAALLEKDPEHKKNVFHENTNVAAEMHTKLATWLEEIGTSPELLKDKRSL